MKRLLTLVLFLTLIWTFSVFAAENGENVFLKVWDSVTDDPTAGLWDVCAMDDMDNDGLDEFLVCSDENGATLYLYECAGNDEYAQVWSYNISDEYCNYSYTLDVGDLDCDGIDEMIVGVATSDTITHYGIHIFEWDGVDGSDTYPLQCMYNVNEGDDTRKSGSISALGVGDFDDDGVDEMFLGETIYDDLFIVSLDTLSDFEYPNWIIEFEDRLDDEGGDYSPWGFVSGDFDGDGYTEIATTEWDYNALIVIQVDGADTYSTELWWNNMTYPNDGCALRSLCAYDLDDNGFDEIILPSTNGTIYTITNTGTFVDLDQAADALDSLTTIDDINGGALGNVDMYLGSRGEPDIYMTGDDGELTDLEYIGGNYKDIASWELYSVYVDTNIRLQHVALGDFDDDGLKDMVVIHKDDSQPGKILVFEHEPLKRGECVTSAVFDSTTYAPGLYQIRDVAAGSDLDQDGKPEVFVTDYRDGGFIHGYEVVGDNTIEYIWSSDTIKSTAYAANRNVCTGDLDNDGVGEVIFLVSGNAGDGSAGSAGLNVYEWDGSTDNGFTVYAHDMIDDAWDSDRWRFEQVAPPFDVDGDGVNELLIANNGSDNAVGDKFMVISIDGDFDSYFSVEVEAEWDQANSAFGGSPYYGNYGDLDGDGTYEVVFSAWDHGGIFIVDVTGANTYENVNYFYTDPWMSDYVHYCGTAIADYDGDGRDEIMGSFYGSYTNVIVDIDGAIADATQAANVNVVRDKWGGGGWTLDAVDWDGDGRYSAFCPDYTHHMYEISLMGSNCLNQSDWIVKSVTSHSLEDDSYGFFSVDATEDTDGDDLPEVWMGFLESFDYEPQVWLKLVEYTGQVGSYIERELRVITPADYKLSQNYPNPFNPNTQINFELPLAKDVTLKIYDMLGHEVVTLVNEHKQAGSYTVTWDGKNAAGMNVATGNYIYQLRAGHVVKSKVMTLVK